MMVGQIRLPLDEVWIGLAADEGCCGLASAGSSARLTSMVGQIHLDVVWFGLAVDDGRGLVSAGGSARLTLMVGQIHLASDVGRFHQDWDEERIGLFSAVGLVVDYLVSDLREIGQTQDVV